jgi:hypothetical protein
VKRRIAAKFSTFSTQFTTMTQSRKKCACLITIKITTNRAKQERWEMSVISLMNNVQGQLKKTTAETDMKM